MIPLARSVSLRLAAVGAALLAGCATAPKPAPVAEKPSWVEAPDTAERVRLTIVGTNDLHGWIEPHDRTNIERGEPVLGGIDAFAGYMNILRARRPGGVVLLDAGDLFQGTLVANMTEGEAVIKAYNLLDYDAAAVGNHEFDYGPVGEPVVAVSPADDPLGNLKRRIEQANFPFLVGNIVDKATGKPIEWPNARRVHLIERKGVSIGIIGLSTPTTPSVTLSQNVQSLDFKPLVESTKELAAELRGRGAQVVILTMHAGGGCNHLGDPNDLGSCDPKGELFQLLEQLPKGTVDAAIAGHTHQYLSHFVNGTPAIQSSSFGVAFGMIELVFDKKAGRVDPGATKIWQPVPLCRKVFSSTHDCRKEADGQLLPAEFMGLQVQPDEKIHEALRADFRLVERRKNEELGPHLEKAFGRSRTKESDLGDLVADIMLQTIPGANVAFTNSGGLRADINAGPVTYGDVFNALPFENRLAVLQLTGKELLDLLVQGVSGEHGVLQLAGVRMEVLESGAQPCEGSSRLLSATFENGKPIVPTERYTVVTNDFVAGGGDGYDRVLGKVDPDRIQVRNDLPPLREVVVAHLRVHPEITGPVRPPAPRIRFARPVCASGVK